MPKAEVKAIVQTVVHKGRHGPFAIARAEGIRGTITFSLGKDVWQEEDMPQEEMHVMLSRLRKKRGKWRALGGRFLQPSDEVKQATEEDCSND